MTHVNFIFLLIAFLTYSFNRLFNYSTHDNHLYSNSNLNFLVYKMTINVIFLELLFCWRHWICWASHFSSQSYWIVIKTKCWTLTTPFYFWLSIWISSNGTWMNEWSIDSFPCTLCIDIYIFHFHWVIDRRKSIAVIV